MLQLHKAWRRVARTMRTIFQRRLTEVSPANLTVPLHLFQVWIRDDRSMDAITWREIRFEPFREPHMAPAIKNAEFSADGLPRCGLVTKATGSQSQIPRHVDLDVSKLACRYRTRCDARPPILGIRIALELSEKPRAQITTA